MDLERLETILAQIAQTYLTLLDEVSTLRRKEEAIQDSAHRVEERLKEIIKEKSKIIQDLKSIRDGGPK